MTEIWTIFRNYCGTGIFPLLFLAALVYLLITEKKRRSNPKWTPQIKRIIHLNKE